MPAIKTNNLKLSVIVGLPGSGKTTYLKRLVKEGVIDNYCDDYQFGPIKQTNPALSDNDKKLLAGLSRRQRWAIADTRFCDKNERRKLTRALKMLFPNLKIIFIYFENRPDLCESNATIRKGELPRHEINLIYYYTELYNIPKSSKIIKVYAGSQ